MQKGPPGKIISGCLLNWCWLFADLSLDFETFADHAVMVARFHGGSCHAERFVWPCPQPVPWSQVPSSDSAVDFSYPADPSAQYAALWQQREHSAQVALQDHWVPAMKGRGQQTKPRRVVGRHAPIKLRALPRCSAHLLWIFIGACPEVQATASSAELP